MKVEIFKPSPTLSNFIDNYMLLDIDWRNVIDLESIWRVIPYGKVSMLLVYGDPHECCFGENEIMHYTRRAVLTGPHLQPVWLKFSGHTRLIVIQFKFSGAQSFLPINMEKLRSVPSLDLEEVWGRAINELMEQLDESISDGERINKINIFLEKRLLPQTQIIDYVDYAINEMKTNNGALLIKSFEEKLGISTRQLERLFRSKIGLTPKEMSKLIRLNNAFLSLQAEPNISLTKLSYEAGYYDQSHFSRDFKSVVGINPTEFFLRSSQELFVTNGGNFVKQVSIIKE